MHLLGAEVIHYYVGFDCFNRLRHYHIEPHEARLLWGKWNVEKKSKMRVVFFLDDFIKLMKKVNRADTGREKEKEPVCVQSQCKKQREKAWMNLTMTQMDL